MQIEPTERFTPSAIYFGATVDCPNINFIIAIDLNGQKIHIPYANLQITVQQLIRNYLQHTSCRQLIKEMPTFRIRNGPFKDQIAVGSYKISSMGLKFQQPCFTVVNKVVDKKQVERSMIKFSGLNSLVIVPVKLLVEGNKLNYKINNNDTIIRLKSKLLNDIPQLTQYNIQSIKLMHKGFALFDQDSVLKTYGIMKEDIISVIIKKNQGCFRNTCLITCKNSNKRISEIQVGDKILSYNSQKNLLQEDRVINIYKTVLQQSVVIKLQNGLEIETTPNHRFLCSDNQYRMVQFSFTREQNLKKGSILKLADGSDVPIQQIRSKQVYPTEQFYHLSIQNNHNFIVDNFIAHNMYVNLKIAQQQNHRLDVSPGESLADIKQKIGLIYYKSPKNIRLLFAGKQISDQLTLSDANITKDSTLNVIDKKSENFNYIFGQSRVLTFSGDYVAISSIKIGDKIVTYDPINNRRNQISGIVAKISTLTLKNYMRIYLDSINKYIIVYPDSYIETSNCKAIHVKDLCQITDGSRPLLKNVQADDFRVHAMTQDMYQTAQTFYRLQIDNSSSYIIQGAVIHNLVLNLAIKTNKSIVQISLGVNSDTTILQAKQKLQSIIKIPAKQQIFTFNDLILQNEMEIYQYGLKITHLIVVTIDSYLTGKSSILLEQQYVEKIQDKKFYLVFSAKEKLVITYRAYAHRTVEDVMNELVPNFNSCYFLIFDKLRIYPHEKISRLQESQSFGLNENEVIVVRNQKSCFVQAMNFKKQHIQNHSYIYFQKPVPSYNKNQDNKSQITIEPNENVSQIFDNQVSQIFQINAKQYKKQRFYKPFLLYTSHQYEQQINQYIRNFQKHMNEVNNKNSVFSIIKNLYVNMHLLDNYYGLCFFGIRNFKFSKFFRPDQVFYWHSFTTAHKNKNNIMNDLKNEVGTLFYINSLTGKQIKQFSLHPENEQILFSAFSYFMVVKIEEGEDVDKVWIDQIPSPITFEKNIVLWVDDSPSRLDNLALKRMIELEDIQVIQLTSTAMAEKWIKEFGWILKWKGIRFKLISNMKRYQGQPKQLRQQAGIDLLKCLYKLNGFTSKTLIFCGNKAKALEKAKANQINESRYEITNQEKDVEKFAKRQEN